MRNKPTNYVVHNELRLRVALLASIAAQNTAQVFAKRVEKNQFFYDQPDYLIGNEVNISGKLRLFSLYCSRPRCIFCRKSNRSCKAKPPQACASICVMVRRELHRIKWKRVQSPADNTRWPFDCGRKRAHWKINWRSLIIFLHILIGN